MTFISREGGSAQLLTAHDVAHMLQVPVKWVSAKAATGELPSLKVGVYRRGRV